MKRSNEALNELGELMLGLGLGKLGLGANARNELGLCTGLRELGLGLGLGEFEGLGTEKFE